MTAPADRRIVFVGGLHRSGTTPLTRWLAVHDQISALTDTGVPEDEGQHLQDVYPTAGAFGGPGRFALDGAAHLTEADAEPGAAERLLAAWDPHWDLSRPVLVEKSPPNLVRMRYLQALFGAARFVAVVRHPVAVAYATQKWTGQPVAELLANWAAAHGTLLEDLPHVRRVIVVRYEDLVREPSIVLAQLWPRLGLPPSREERDVRSELNAGYLARWEAEGAATRAAAAAHGPVAGAFGYRFEAAEPGPPASELVRDRLAGPLGG